MSWCTGEFGNRLWYEESGTGTPVVFIHGWCMSSAVWEQQQVLSNYCRVIVLDLRGHGKSSAAVDGFSIKGCAADIARLFDALDLQNALLAGWSLGSLIALESFPLLRKRISGLVLIAATPRFTEGGGFPYGLSQVEAQGMARKVQRNMRRALDGFIGRMFANGELGESSRASTIQDLLATIALATAAVALQALEALVEADLRDRLNLIDLPTLIMNGDHDVICLPQASEYLAQRIPRSRQVVFAGCGHAPFLTQSNRFNACLEEFRGMVSVVH